VPPRRAPTPWRLSGGIGMLAFHPRVLTSQRTKARFMPRGGSTLGPVPADLGRLMPIGQVVSRVEREMRINPSLPGDPWVRDYHLWDDAKKRNEKVPPIAPGELNEDEKKKFDDLYGKLIVEDLKDYVPFVFDVVPEARDIPVEVEATNAPGYPGQVGLLYQFGCRQLSQRLPGYAKIVIKHIVVTDTIDLVGDWSAPIDATALPKTSGKKSEAPAKTAEPPYKPKEEIVEVCSVTHRQVEETLKKDLRALALAVRKGAKAAEGRELMNPLSGLAFEPVNGEGPGPEVKAAAHTIPLLDKPIDVSTDRRGGDFRSFPLSGPAGNAKGCQFWCGLDKRCKVFTFVRAEKKCFLNSNARPAQSNKPCCDSGVMR
jgi:hypothetical protein